MLSFFINNISLTDILYAAVLAFIITWLIRSMMRIRVILSTLSESNPISNKEDIKAIVERCYYLFPMDKIQFHGREFKRGMKIKIVTLQNKIFTGEFIGGNNKNMLCIKTSKNIIAHDITNITEITALDEAK
jgi:hypothetical protein